MNHADVAGGASHEALEQRAVFVADIPAAAPAIPAERGLDLVPNLVVDDALVLALVNLAAILHLPGVDHVGEQVVEIILGDRLSARLSGRRVLSMPSSASPRRSSSSTTGISEPNSR